jgi:3-oxoacyl-[acyl-carrier protein] reductase
MDTGLHGKAAIVGGASQGIGFAIARLLALEGAKVAMVARKEERLREAVAQIGAECEHRPIAIPADIRKAEDCARIVKSAVEQLGELHVLVNNDGAPPLANLVECDDAAWDKAIQQNFMSVVRLTRDAIPHMRSAGYGRIVNITALSVLQPVARFGLSVATWAGVLGYAKTLSLEVAGNGITVNTICPGRIATPRLAKIAESSPQDAKAMEETARQTPAGRLGTPDEIAGLAVFLASTYAAYMTGGVFHVDGGRRASLL